VAQEHVVAAVTRQPIAASAANAIVIAYTRQIAQRPGTRRTPNTSRQAAAIVPACTAVAIAASRACLYPR
jgi:hypothetical protein